MDKDLVILRYLVIFMRLVLRRWRGLLLDCKELRRRLRMGSRVDSIKGDKYFLKEGGRGRIYWKGSIDLN